jgi:acetyl esterase/lipase
MNRILKRIVIITIAFAIIIFLAFKLSPYPSVWIVRHAFNKDAVRANKQLEAFVPGNIESIINLKYDENDNDAYLDVYFNKDFVRANMKLPVIVWTHGGGLISGSKNHVSNYCKLLASRGYVAIAIDYTVAPENKYPAPIEQLNKALLYISSNPGKLNADTASFFLGGDSGGSMISATAANVITNSNYAQLIKVKPGLRPNQLKGLLLYCGIYDITHLNTEGGFGSFVKTVLWAYFGKKDISNDEYAKNASITNFLTNSFPPSFISAGNNDPLLPQSNLLTKKLSALNIKVDTLYFPQNMKPALGHEFQFTFDDAGKLAFERSIRFLKSIK